MKNAHFCINSESGTWERISNCRSQLTIHFLNSVLNSAVCYNLEGTDNFSTDLNSVRTELRTQISSNFQLSSPLNAWTDL